MSNRKKRKKYVTYTKKHKLMAKAMLSAMALIVVFSVLAACVHKVQESSFKKRYVRNSVGDVIDDSISYNMNTRYVRIANVKAEYEYLKFVLMIFEDRGYEAFYIDRARMLLHSYTTDYYTLYVNERIETLGSSEDINKLSLYLYEKFGEAVISPIS